MAGERRTELHARLLALFETFRAAAHVRCDVTLEASHTCFGEEASEIVYDTIRELLLNVHKHAKATRVEISSVKRRDGSIGIIVADNGVGLPAHRRRGRPLLMSARSASTISATSSLKPMLWLQPSFARAFAGSPISSSISAERT